MTHGGREEFEAALDAMVTELLVRFPDDPDAPSVEREVLSFLAPYEQLGGEIDADRELVEAFVRAGSRAAADALATIGRFATPELAEMACAGLELLSSRGVATALEPQLGRLEVGGAWRLEPAEGTNTCLLAFLERPGQQNPEGWFAIVDGGRTGGALTAAGWLPPKSLSDLDAFSAELREEWGLAEPVGMTADDLGVALRPAVDRCEALRLDIDGETAAALLLMGLALADDPGAFAGPEIDAPQAGDFRPADDAEAEEMIAGFVRELRVAAGSIESVSRSGEVTAYAALGWKWERDADLRTWRTRDLEGLIDALPQELAEAPIAAGDVPACLEAVFLAMEELDLLDGDGERVLSAALRRRADSLSHALEQVVDESPAGVLVQQMIAEGVDLGDREAVEAWNASFNARSFAERDALLGPALDRREQAGRSAAFEHKRSKRTRRRATRQARRRNRR